MGFPTWFGLTALAFLGMILFFVWRLVRNPLPLQMQQTLAEKEERAQQFNSLAQSLKEIENRVVGLQAQMGRDSAFQQNLSQVLEGVHQSAQELARLKGERESDLREFRDQMKGVNQKLGGVYSTLTGRKSGGAGENILREALRAFPPEWVRAPYYDVEFGLVMPDRLVMPIDSKFAAAELLERLGVSEDEQEKDDLIQEIEARVLKRAREVAKYIDPNSTTALAVCAVPDSAFALLRRAPFQAYQDCKVLITPYSMAAPFLLAMFDLRLKYVGQMDETRLDAFIGSIEQAVKSLKDSLENKIRDANTRLSNGYRECVQSVSTIEGALAALKSSRIPSAEQTTGVPT